MQVEYHEVLSSTMDRAREVAAPALIIARHQKNGRGRRGNLWQSEHDGLYFTVALLKNSEATNYQGLSLAVGVWLAESLEQLGEKILLKWPNDLFNREEHKIGGILIELLSDSVLIGVGINLSAPENLPEASALKIEIKDPKKLAETLSQAIAKGFNLFEKQGFAAFQEAWFSRCCWRESEIQGIMNEEVISGVFKGIDRSGMLLLETKDGLRTISSGEISKVRDKR